MNFVNMDGNFTEQMERIKHVTGKKTQTELAYLLGVKHP